MLRVNMTWLIADYSALEDFLEVVLFITQSIGHFVDLRCYVFSVSLPILLLDGRLSTLNVKRRCCLAGTSEPGRPILWTASLTWRDDHHLLMLSKYRMDWLLIAQRLESDWSAAQIGLSLKLLREMLHERWLLVEVVRITSSKCWPKHLVMLLRILVHLRLIINVCGI